MWLFGYFLHVSEGVRSCQTFRIVMLNALKGNHWISARTCVSKKGLPVVTQQYPGAPTANGCGNKATQCDHASLRGYPASPGTPQQLGKPPSRPPVGASLGDRMSPQISSLNFATLS